MNEWKQEKIESWIRMALDASSADDAVVSVNGFSEGATRFANSEINQNVARSDISINIQAAYGSSTGATSTNRMDKESIVACVKRAEEIAKLTPPDPEYMPPVEPVALPQVDTWSPHTAACSPADRAKAVGRAIAVAERRSLKGAGSLTTRDGFAALGNSAGHFAFHKSTEANIAFSASSPDSVGWAEGVCRDVRELDIEAIAERSATKAANGRAPRDIDPGRYEVILEPAAAGELISSFIYEQMDAKTVDEGRSYLSDKRGSRIGSPIVNISSDPLSPLCPVCPFDGDGMKLARVEWLRSGLIDNLIYSRFWAKKQGRAFTGWPHNIIIDGGNATLEALIQSTKRGLLITRFWYIRTVDPMRDLYTGTTRDGTFLIENGQLAGPVKNLRFNDSAARLLGNIQMLGEQRTISGFGLARIPFVKAQDFNFTSTSPF